jgi:7-carboxy-7-deazaguanine synthase
MIDKHNQSRLNVDAMCKLIDFHKDYHFKPVWNGTDQQALEEIEALIQRLNVPNRKVWMMPAGSTLAELQPNYSKVMEYCIQRGFNFSGRAHIVAYNDKRGV